MADGSFPTLISKDRNSNAVANPVYVQLSDGTSALSITSGALDVNVDNTVTIADGGGSITIDGSVSITGSVTIADGGGSITVDASDLDIRNLNLTDDAVKVSANATANSALNPIYVAMTTDTLSATEVHSYDTEASLAADTPDNHDYAVVGSTFLLRSVVFAASGGLKIEVQTGPVASLATKAVAFIPRQGGFGQIDFNPPIEVPVASTGTVRVIRTNRQGASMDVYSTIIGNDLP